MDFRLVPKSANLTDFEQCNGRYFASFYRIASGANYVKMVEHRPILSATTNFSNM